MLMKKIAMSFVSKKISDQKKDDELKEKAKQEKIENINKIFEGLIPEEELCETELTPDQLFELKEKKMQIKEAWERANQYKRISTTINSKRETVQNYGLKDVPSQSGKKSSFFRFKSPKKGTDS